MEKLKVHAIFPDSMVKPVGGLGEQFKQVHHRLKDKIDYYVIGFPEREPLNNYCGVHDMFPMIPHHALNTIANQINYFFSSATCPVKPDIVHTLDYTTYIAGIFAAKFWNVPLVSSMNLSIQELGKLGIHYCYDYGHPDGNSIHNLIEVGEQMGFFYADKVIHVSKDYASKFPEYNDKSIVIPNGIDLKYWDTKHNQYKFKGKNKIKLVYIGRFAKMKGIENLCSANIPDDIDLYFVGDNRGCEGYTYDMVMNKVNNKNIFHIDFAYGDTKRDIMKSADAVIMPSLHEPFGIVGLEALASKSILISSFADGINEYLTKDVGIDCGKTKEGIEKALDILKNLSQNQVKEKINKGYEIAKEFDWDIISNKYYQTYQDLYEQKQSKEFK
jgi:glycosyltransferase involved in cell wall biosynthesis